MKGELSQSDIAQLADFINEVMYVYAVSIGKVPAAEGESTNLEEMLKIAMEKLDMDLASKILFMAEFPASNPHVSPH
jgi:hypothetical protein